MGIQNVKPTVPRTLESLTGPQLKAHRRKAGLSQTAMAAQIDCSRHAVSYWETKPHPIKTRYGVPARMCEVLGLQVLPIKYTSTRAREDGVLDDCDNSQARHSAKISRIDARASKYVATYRQPCGAKTRKGRPCRNMSEAGRRRCKFHGGLSTGPRTPEGKARIAAAQRKRWSNYLS